MTQTDRHTARTRGGATAGRAEATTLGQRFALAVGATFLLVGILGFVPGITQDVGDITFAGHESEAELLGIFEVSILHNIVHLLFGVFGLAAARTYLFAGGVIYLVLAAYGAVTEHDSSANFVPVNTADDALHVVLGLGMLALGAIAQRADRTRRTHPISA